MQASHHKGQTQSKFRRLSKLKVRRSYDIVSENSEFSEFYNSRSAR